MSDSARVSRIFTFDGMYWPVMAVAVLFASLSVVDPFVATLALLLGFVLVYYDMDVVKKVKQSGAPFRALGYFAMVSMVVLVVGFFVGYGHLILFIGVLLSGLGFYIYRRRSLMTLEYGRRYL